MTTDNKTLADVQPGGMVRLGDQAFAQGCDELRMRTDGERAAYLEGVAEGRRAALSAQPSPGGQDALLGYVRVEAIKALREDDEVTGVMVHVEERTNSLPVYLAARQPEVK